MATSTSINIITGRTLTAHVSSDDDAAIWRGLVGSGNVTLTTDNDLELDYSTKGTLVLSPGVFCMNGRMGRIDNSTPIDYNLPSISNTFRRTYLLIRYAMQTVVNQDTQQETQIESMTLMTLQSESEAGDSATAATLPITTGETDYVLYDFVCDEDGVVADTMTSIMTVINGIPAINALYTLLGIRVTDLETGLTNETTARSNAVTAEATARANADTALGNRITTLETWKNAENSSDYKLVRLICPGGAIGDGATLAICKYRERTHGYMFRWENNQYMTYCYELYVYDNSVNVTFYKVSCPFGGGDLVLVSQSGGSATILGSVKFVSA